MLEILEPRNVSTDADEDLLTPMCIIGAIVNCCSGADVSKKG